VIFKAISKLVPRLFSQQKVTLSEHSRGGWLHFWSHNRQAQALFDLSSLKSSYLQRGRETHCQLYMCREDMDKIQTI